MSSPALGAIVLWLDDHHLLRMSQRKRKPAEEEVDKVTFKFLSHQKWQNSRNKTLLPVSSSASTSPFSVGHPSLLKGSYFNRRLAETTTASPPGLLLCIYENSSATGILRETQFSTRKNRREEVCAGDSRWVSTSPLKTELVPKFTMSGRNSPAVLSHQKCPSLCFRSLESTVFANNHTRHLSIP